MTTVITTEIKNQAVAALKQLIAQPSYNQPAAPGAPFGPGIRQALDLMLKHCQQLGFRTYVDPEGYYGYAEIGDRGPVFGVIGHLDTVPAGDLAAWETAPFEPVVKDGKIIGRGAQDDKGPTIAALYAVKALLDAGYQLKQRIRFIFGTDEEILWRGIARYNQQEDPIDSGIAPDAEFPLIYAEKGLEQAYLVGPGTDQFELKMENAFNAVPAKATYDGPQLDAVVAALDRHGFAYQRTEHAVTVLGKAVHAMNAPQGTNAVLRLAIALDEVFDFAPLHFIGQLFKEDATGENVLGKVTDESGQLTFNISNLVVNAKETRMQIDLRIPVIVDRDALIKRLDERVAPYQLKYAPLDYVAPLFVPKDSTLVKTLMKVYQDQTGDQTPPQISGGATFARTMHNCVAYGAMLPDVTDYMHQPNEQWPLESMYKTMEIYAAAIKELCFE